MALLERHLDNSICFNLALRKSNRLITQFYEERLSKVGLKSGQFSILRAVNFLGTTTNKELQSILVIDQTTLSRNLKPLVRDEYLQLSTNPNDARSKQISLSKGGKQLFQQALPLWENAQQDIQQLLGKNEIQKILSLTDNLVKALGD